MSTVGIPCAGAGPAAPATAAIVTPAQAVRATNLLCRPITFLPRLKSVVRGSYRMPVRENLIPLSDGAGEVIEIGPGVTRVKVGDHVAGCFFQRWAGGEAPPDVHASALGGGIDGMLAEYAVLEEDGIVKI